MSDVKSKYGAQGVAITCQLAPSGVGLASGSARESTAIDNTTNLYMDALVQVQIKSGASGTSATGYVNIYAYGSVDGGTTYSDNATGSDAAVTLVAPPIAKLIGRIAVVANATTYKSMPMSVAAAFGGILPDHWGIIIENQCGAALDTTESNHKKMYQGVYASSV